MTKSVAFLSEAPEVNPVTEAARLFVEAAAASPRAYTPEALREMVSLEICLTEDAASGPHWGALAELTSSEREKKLEELDAAIKEREEDARRFAAQENSAGASRSESAARRLREQRKAVAAAAAAA